jgi:hypothetical protein
MVRVTGVVVHGCDLQVSCEVLANPSDDGGFAGEVLGTFTLRVLTGTPHDVLVGMVRQQAAMVREDGLRACTVRSALLSEDLERAPSGG